MLLLELEGVKHLQNPYPIFMHYGCTFNYIILNYVSYLYDVGYTVERDKKTKKIKYQISNLLITIKRTSN